MSTSLHGGPVSLTLWTSGREPRGCQLTAVLWARVGRPSLAPFRSSPLSHALVLHPPVFLLLQSGPHAVLLPALLSRLLRPSRGRRDAVSPGGSQDHHLGVRVPQERMGAFPAEQAGGLHVSAGSGCVHARIQHFPSTNPRPSVHRSLITGSHSALLPEGM